MSDDPAHKAMLYFLEVLMNSNGPLTISQMAGRFGSRSFSLEMRAAAGGNEAGLKKFLLKYPSLFTVKGNMVSLYDGKSLPSQDLDSSETSSNGSDNFRRRSLPDVSVELQAVSFFQMKLSKKEERWVPIKSLSGHLSQAVQEVRSIVGPQVEFRNWLLKHPHIFEVQGELVGLRDGMAAMATPAVPTKRIQFQETPAVRVMPSMPLPRTPPSQRKNFTGSSSLRRSRSFSDKVMIPNGESEVEPPAPVTPVPKRKSAPITMTANEYKAVIFLKELIEKEGSVKVGEIPSHYGAAEEATRVTIGWTKAEQEDFMRRYNSIFVVSEYDDVTLMKNAKLDVIITSSKPLSQAPRTLNEKKGAIFHVSKLWGIIDLGKHEHVFFDKSIMRRPMDDLQKFFRANEILYFNAVLAPKSSRAKWRATHVWRELEQQPSGSESDLSMNDTSLPSPALSIEDEINRFLPAKQEGEMAFFGTQSHDSKNYSDAIPSAAGVIPVWNFRENQSENARMLTMVPESYAMAESCLRDAVAPKYISKRPVQGDDRRSTKEIGCQTVSTGDIIATQLYNEL